MPLAPGPHRDLQVQRLRSAIQTIDEFQARDPAIHDPEFEEWNRSTMQVLTELFSTDFFGYLQRFVKVSCRATTRFNRELTFRQGFRDVWRQGLEQKRVILTQALQEAEIPLPERVRTIPPRPEPPAPAPLVVNVHNQISNAFSPSLHVTIAQVLQTLDAMDLSGAEKESAREELKALEAETTGQQRWPVIARSVEALKTIGKDVYKDVAIPLLVEFLKKQSGLTNP